MKVNEKNICYAYSKQKTFVISIPVKVDFKERILQEINCLLCDDESDD